MAEIGAQVFPPGVFQALSGDDSLGSLLTAHPGVSKVSFTGSVETGKKVMAACAATLKRVTLELGGNDATIVCDDVDIESVAAKVRALSRPTLQITVNNIDDEIDRILYLYELGPDMHGSQAYLCP